MYAYIYLACAAAFHFSDRKSRAHEADKVSVVARAVSIKASARNCILLARMYLLLHERRVQLFTHTHNFIYDAENGGEKEEEVHRRTPSAFGCSAHLSGLFAKRFMISDSDMAERSSINFTITHGARLQIKRRLSASVNDAPRFRLISRPGFRRKMQSLNKPRTQQMEIILVLCKCRGAALEKSIQGELFKFKGM